MKQIIFVFICLTTFSCGNRVMIKPLQVPKKALHSYQTSPLFVTELTGDSLIGFFKEKSIFKSLPISYNQDSLINLNDQVNYNIRLLPFITDEFSNEFEPSSFTPFCYEFNRINQLHSFYIYMQSMPFTNAFYAVFLFTCDSALRVIDYFPISQNWLFSGSAGSSRDYRRQNPTTFFITDNDYDIDYNENGNGINYLVKIKSIISISNDGKIKLNKTDTMAWEEIVKFE